MEQHITNMTEEEYKEFVIQMKEGYEKVDKILMQRYTERMLKKVRDYEKTEEGKKMIENTIKDRENYLNKHGTNNTTNKDREDNQITEEEAR